MSVSALPMLDQKFDMRLPRSSMTQCQDANGNDLPPGFIVLGLDTGYTEGQDTDSFAGGQEYDLEDHFDRLNLHGKSDEDCVDGRELEPFGGTKRRVESLSQKDVVKVKRCNQQAEIRPPPTGLVQCSMPPSYAHCSYSGNDFGSCQFASVCQTRQFGKMPVKTGGHNGNIPSESTASFQKSPPMQMPFPDSPTSHGDLPSEVDPDGAPIHSEAALSKIEQIKAYLMASQPPCTWETNCPATQPSLLPGSVSGPRGTQHLISKQNASCPFGKGGFANIVNGQVHFQPSGPPEDVMRSAPLSMIGSVPTSPKAIISVTGPAVAVSGTSPPVNGSTRRTPETVPGQSAVFSRGLSVSGPPSMRITGPPSVSGENYLASSAASPTSSRPCLSSTHSGSNSSISSSCSGNEKNLLVKNVTYSPPPSDTQPHQVCYSSSSTSGGLVTCLSTGVSSPPMGSIGFFRWSSSSPGDSGRSSLENSPAGSSPHCTSYPESPDPMPPQRSPRNSYSVATPLSSDSDYISPPGSCQSPGSAIVPTRVQAISPESPVAVAPIQSPSWQQVESSPRNYMNDFPHKTSQNSLAAASQSLPSQRVESSPGNCRGESSGADSPNSTPAALQSPVSQQVESSPSNCVVESPGITLQNSAPVTLQGHFSQQLESSPRNCTSASPQITAPVSQSQRPNFLDVQDPCEHLILEPMRGESPGIEVRSGRSLAVCDAVCDENGHWLEDGEGDTFLHSLPGWEDEDAALENLFHVKDKSGFLHALNKHNKGSETPIYSAVCMGKQKLVAAMIQRGADVNLQCCFETQAHSPLHRAVEQGDADMVEVLLQSPSVNINAQRCSDNCTALMVALMKHVPHHRVDDQFRIIKLLVEEDSNVNYKTRDRRSGKTVLMFAVETKDVRVVDLILRAVGVDGSRELLNMPNWAGNTAVHLAAGLHSVAAEVKEQILRRLIQFGGDTNKKNNEGDSPKDWARNMIDRVARLR